MTKEELDEITNIIKWKVAREPRVMFLSSWLEGSVSPTDKAPDDIDMLIEMVFSLHNLLYQEVTGERYNYWFHWTNKIGAWAEECYFDEAIKNANRTDDLYNNTRSSEFQSRKGGT